MADSTAPGAIAFTRTRGAKSSAATRVRAVRAPLLAAYASRPLDVATAWTDEMLTTAPEVRSSASRRAVIARYAARTFTAIVRSQRSRAAPAAGDGASTPA